LLKAKFRAIQFIVFNRIFLSTYQTIQN